MTSSLIQWLVLFIQCAVIKETPIRFSWLSKLVSRSKKENTWLPSTSSQCNEREWLSMVVHSWVSKPAFEVVQSVVVVVAFFSTAASTTRKAQAPLYHQHRLRRRLQRGRGRRPLYYYCSSLVAPTSKACLELCAVSAAENITMKRSWEL